MFKPYTEHYQNECIDIFYNIYYDNKYNYSWLNKTKIKRYFNDIQNTPNFEGYIQTKDNKIAGVCFGTINDYFNINKYYIKELFVKKELQGNGIGSTIIDNLKNELLKKNIKIIEIQTNNEDIAFDFYIKNNFKQVNSISHMIKII